MISQEIINFEKKVKSKSLAVIQKAITKLSDDIVYDTPIDTGRLRNNWIPSINKGVNQSNIGTDKSGSKVKEAVREATLAMKLGDTYYFTNNLIYAKQVEFGLYPAGPKIVNGFSAKSPKGMVRVNLLRWSKYFD